MKKNIYALSLFLGTVIGVGIFGLPYVAARAGFVVVLAYFGIMGCVVYAIDRAYGEITVSIPGRHRFPGYAGKIFGQKAKVFSFGLAMISFTGTLLAYLIVGGSFLHKLFEPFFGGDVALYTIIYFFFGALLILVGLKSIAQTEACMLVFFFLITGILVIIGLPKISIANIGTLDIKNAFLPYGVIMFSLWGIDIIPEIRDMFNGNSKKLARTLKIGTIITIATYLLFTVTVLGITGSDTTKDAMIGLAPFFSRRIMVLGYIFGILTTFTSFIALGLTMKKILWYDFKFNPIMAWCITCSLPLGLYLLGFQDYINIIGIMGSIFLGINGIMIFRMYKKIKEKKENKREIWNISNIALFAIEIIFIMGILLEIYYTIKPMSER